MKKCFLIPAMLSLALALIVADSAQAQRFSIGFGGGRGLSIGNGYNGNGNYGNGNYGYGNSGYGNYGRGYYGGGGSYGPGYYNSPYSNGYYGNSYYSAPYTAIAPRISYYNEPTPVVAIQYAPVADSTAHIRVIVPVSAARVWMNGSPTQQSGFERVFSTPALTSGYSYSYRIRATWTQDGRESIQEKVVEVFPGQTAVADFR